MAQEIITEERVFDELKKAIVNALGVDAESIKPESILTMDLGAESLDFLDINYNLEQVFGFRMARHFLLEHAEEMFGEGSTINEHGQLTHKALKLLGMRFGEDLSSWNEEADMDGIINLISVQSMAGGVMDILDSLPERCVSCSHSAWKTDDGTHIICGSCGASASFTNGDDLTIEWLNKIQKEKRIF